MEKIRKTNPFIVFPLDVPGQSDFDQEYESIEIYDKVVKVGEGDEDFVIVKDVKKTKRLIKDVVNADKDSVGVENIIKQVLRTGDTSLLPVDKGDCNVDLVGAPESLMDLKNLGVDAEKAYNSLPADLVKGLDMKTFVENLTQEQFDSFVKAFADRNKGDNKDEQ